MEKAQENEHERRIEAAKANLRLAGGAASARRVSPLVRQLLTEIEDAIAAGARLEEIRMGLEEAGFPIKLGTFKKSLARARKRESGNRKGGGQGATGRASTAVSRAATGPLKDKGTPVQKRDPLAMPPRPKKFEWDPMERPVIEFVDDPPKAK